VIDIKGLRIALKMSQTDMCEVLDMPQPLLSAIENKRKPLPKSAYQKLYNLYGDIVLKYKLPDIVIEVKKSEAMPVFADPTPEYGHPPMQDVISYLREKDAELKEKEKEIRQLIKDLATAEAKLDIAKKGGYCLKEKKEGDAECANAS